MAKDDKATLLWLVNLILALVVGAYVGRWATNGKWEERVIKDHKTHMHVIDQDGNASIEPIRSK